MDLSDAVRETIKAVSTATLTTRLWKRGLRNVFICGVHKINPQAPRLVGPAFTLRYFPTREDIEERVQAGQSVFGLYPPGEEATAEFAAWRQQKG